MAAREIFSRPDMLQTLTNSLSRWLFSCALLAGIVALTSDGFAQVNDRVNDSFAQMPQGAPPPPPQAGQPGATGNPICQRLEMQLATIDRGAGTGDPAKDEQIRKYQDAQARQQAELDRVTSQAKRMGCESSGFFSLFNQNSAQCGPVNNQIQQMRGNLDQITTSLERLRSGGLGGADRENQRRSVITALAQNNCGPQYAAAAREQGQGGPGGFLGGLFGNNNATPIPGSDLGSMSGTYRTVCVRTCDGAYFPVSFATVSARFPDDEKTCKALCPATEANLYAYPNPGGDMNQAVSTSGQPYTALPTAFKFRASHDPTCSCKAAGQTWSDALKAVDDKATLEQQGDIIVTEESAKKMQQQKMQAQQPKGAPAAGKKGQPATTAGTPPAPAEASPPADGKDKPIRSVGPTFIPNNNSTTR
jgi:Protein of unknown function (DUF2865)